MMGRNGRLATAICLLFLPLLLGRDIAHADPAWGEQTVAPRQVGGCSCGGWVEGDEVEIGGAAGESGGAAPQGGDGQADEPRVPSGPTAYWTSHRVAFRTRGGGMGVGLVQEPMPPCTTTDGRQGQTYRFTLHSVSGETIRNEMRCVADGDDPDPAAQGFIDPPTVEQLLDLALIPEPQVRVDPSPEIRGLTGLESYFWAEPPGEVAVDDSALGWTVAASLDPVEWQWDVGDEGTYTTDGPGSQDDPAVAHLYETKGTWTVTVTVTWEGSFTVSNPDLDIEYEVPGLSAEQSGSFEYQVIEARAVVDEEGAD